MDLCYATCGFSIPGGIWVLPTCVYTVGYSGGESKGVEGVGDVKFTLCLLSFTLFKRLVRLREMAREYLHLGNIVEGFQLLLVHY